MKISGHTKPYAVLGHPVGHSLSPAMHNAAFQSLGMDAIYLAFDVAPSDLGTVLSAMKLLGFGGLNLTVPLKEEVLPYLSERDTYAQRLGAVNTVRFLPQGSLKGYNTDGAGFLDGIREAFSASVKGLSVLLVGSGGAGRAVAITCAMEGAAKVAVSDIEPSRANRLVSEISSLTPSVPTEAVEATSKALARACASADLVVQATPVGLKPSDPSPLGTEAFRAGQLAYDLIYTAPQTAFMKAAAQAGAKTANGLGMLLRQGARAFSIWTDKQAPIDAMRQALTAEVYAK
jgi:shikimate dehydrogenase